ncbi:hypothetical protein BASA50_005778 [Batrachochytrium salamandrivorans]|uniref:Cation/H+ exchanger domain-containing protein n=1 Tax=Batrachochytrium salamandrivorans TaxID=1357716 RepID=A0ABQ8FBQ4_9FUNG|nr:hypothetical protein BASA62_010232 [Batrachochytrium salamandrivorans]KAH6580383.1 hypothetical protein BASA60_002879 [Batrachochytrium salamandrivorans]KAH6587390.1 hypothetical protein BASA61_006312 [Batrachochytrium salamandrivorans]KAH6595478.1 hypothetical protein BASA50_005778 [Batrachochytrium salamandrivorans]KAH9263147.1 hypothetical protein BASA83_013513 [Batrachochytrium salamandrivorans]
MQSEAALTTVIALATLVGLPGVGLLEDPMQGMIPIVLVALLGRLTVLPLLASYTDQNNSHVWPSTVVQTSIGVLQNTLMFYILGVGFGAPLLIWIDKTLLASIYAAAMIDPSSAYTVFKLFSRKSQNVSLSSQDQHVFWRLVATMMGAWIAAVFFLHNDEICAIKVHVSVLVFPETCSPAPLPPSQYV